MVSRPIFLIFSLKSREKSACSHGAIFVVFPTSDFLRISKTRFSIAIYWLCRWRFTWISLLFDSPQVFYDGKVCSILFKTCFPDVPRTGNTISDQIVKSYQSLNVRDACYPFNSGYHKTLDCTTKKKQKGFPRKIHQSDDHLNCVSRP